MVIYPGTFHYGKSNINQLEH